jgi:GNAT superfamily N-acetyltransferase
MSTLGLWRLTRNEYARGVYDALKAAGVTATRMYEYVAPLDELPDRPLPEGVTVERRRGAEVDAAERADFADPTPADDVLVAREGGAVVGYLFVSDRTVHVAALDADLSFEGVYVWRAFVEPEHRQRGIATGLVARALALARERGCGSVHALIAADNRPSQWAFEACGFRRRHVYSYLKLRGFERRRLELAPGARPRHGAGTGG